MYKSILIAMSLFLTFNGCSSQDSKIKNELNCYVDHVINTKSNISKGISKEESLENNFVYHFKVYDNGILTVNDVERYSEMNITDSKDGLKTFFLLKKDGVTKDVMFQFGNSFKDVKFFIVPEGIEYDFVCE